MRISDWSSDVCSSDLRSAPFSAAAAVAAITAPAAWNAWSGIEAPSPAPFSTATSTPISTNRLTVSGDPATRVSWARRSLRMAIFIQPIPDLLPVPQPNAASILTDCEAFDGFGDQYLGFVSPTE